MSDASPPNDPLDEAFAAYLRTCDAGELSSRQEFLEQFPDLAGELEQLIEAADMFGQVSLELAGEKPASISEPGAETLAAHATSGEDSDPAVTLPIAHRDQGGSGPTLPFDLGDYMLLEVIGRGGMGVVYLANQHELDRNVAVKMIRNGILADDNEVRRFYTEAQTAARLHHRGIVAVYQFGRRAGHHFFSMEYIRGIDLQRRINDSILEPDEAARYVRDVARAIHHAHENGVLHRDLKPANVLIDERDQIHVTDFGLAKHMESDSSVTGSGAAIGTPYYMAPEQAGGQSDRASLHSDVYSLGAVLFACVTGRPPIVADTIMQTLVQVVHHPAPLVRSVRADVPLDLETIIAKCLEKKPGERYESAAKLADELDAFLEGRPIEARPRSRAIKVWHWLEGVPLVGALTGRRVLHSSDTHRRFQAGMLLLLLMMPLFAGMLHLGWQSYIQAMPRHLHIAGGIEDGLYTKFARILGDRIELAHEQVDATVIRSNGSVQNASMLLDREVDLAPMQATSINDRLCVVAPMFHELLYVFARADSGIASVSGLAGKRVAVGPEGGGSIATAEMVLESIDLSEDVIQVHGDWRQLLSDDTPDAAMICIGRGSTLVSDLISDGRWILIPILDGVEISLGHSALLHAMWIHPDEHRNQKSTTSIPTVGTTSYLAARDDTPSVLVHAALDALYGSPRIPNLISRQRAAEGKGLNFHDAANEYFSAYRDGSSRDSGDP